MATQHRPASLTIPCTFGFTIARRCAVSWVRFFFATFRCVVMIVSRSPMLSGVGQIGPSTFLPGSISYDATCMKRCVSLLDLAARTEQRGALSAGVRVTRAADSLHSEYRTQPSASNHRGFAVAEFC